MTDSPATATSQAFPLTLPADLTIREVGELRDDWLRWVQEALADDASDTLPLLAAGVKQIDSAGTQLLLSLDRLALQQQRPLRLVAPSPALVEACAQLGMAQWLAARTTHGA